MFGMPNTHPLSAAVERLARPHIHHSRYHSGLEEALLVTLANAVASSSGKGSASGVSRTGSPVDLGAMVLLDRIGAVIEENNPTPHDPIARCRPLPRRLVRWTESIAGDPTEEDILLQYCIDWETEIRAHLEPAKEIPLRGVACLKCGVSEVMEIAPDGERTRRPILTAYASEDPIRVQCTVCDHQWIGSLQLREYEGLC